MIPRTFAQRLHHRIVGPQYQRPASWPYGEEYARCALTRMRFIKDSSAMQRMLIEHNRLHYSGATP